MRMRLATRSSDSCSCAGVSAVILTCALKACPLLPAVVLRKAWRLAATVDGLSFFVSSKRSICEQHHHRGCQGHVARWEVGAGQRPPSRVSGACR